MWTGLRCLFSSQHRRKHQNDIHNRLMQNYLEVPLWWYATVFILSFALGVVALIKFLPEAPVWVWAKFVSA